LIHLRRPCNVILDVLRAAGPARVNVPFQRCDVSKKKIRKRLSQIRKEIVHLTNEQKLLFAVLEARELPPPHPKRCWVRAFEICSSIWKQTRRRKITFRKTWEIAFQQGLRVPARWQTLERHQQAYWRRDVDVLGLINPVHCIAAGWGGKSRVYWREDVEQNREECGKRGNLP
jgi:hypothetical protein